MRARKPHNFDLGEAISMEDAISMMTIIFVLFVVFLVPLVSIDKARLEKKTVDHFWSDVVQWLAAKSNGVTPEATAYREAFDLFDPLFMVSEIRQEETGNIRYVEALSTDSSLIIIRHDLNDNKFSQMNMGINGETITYRHGKLSRLSGNANWFSAQENDPDYGDDPRSKGLFRRYRQWRVQSMKGSL